MIPSAAPASVSSPSNWGAAGARLSASSGEECVSTHSHWDGVPGFLRVPSSASGGSPVAIACPVCPPAAASLLAPGAKQGEGLCRPTHPSGWAVGPLPCPTPWAWLLPAPVLRDTAASRWVCTWDMCHGIEQGGPGHPGGGSDPASSLSGQVLIPGLHPACTVGAGLPFKSPSRGDEHSLCLGTGPNLTVPPWLLLAEGPGEFLLGMGKRGWCFPTWSGGPEHLLCGGQWVPPPALVSGAWVGGSNAVGVRLLDALSATVTPSRSLFHVSAVSPLYLGRLCTSPLSPSPPSQGWERLNPFPLFSSSTKPGSGFSGGVLGGLF